MNGADQELGEELAKRVEDGITFVQIMTAVMGVLTFVLGLGLGLSIWRTE